MQRATVLASCLITFLPVLSSICRAADEKTGYADPPMPAYRVESEGFKASDRDIKAVCDSAGRELWRYFPDYEIEPFVIMRGRSGPIVLFHRNDRGEIVMRLDTESTFWCQYAYQFAHEFCHILCGYDDDYAGNKWFEETICETASLFAMRAMARAWTKDPPYAHWKDYRDALRNYTDDVIAKRRQVYEIYEKGLPEFYREHQDELRKNAGLRDVNGAMSLVMLRLFEEDPRRWEAVRWLNHLNSSPSPKGEAFRQYLQRWHDAVPEKHKPFVRRIAKLYGESLSSAIRDS